MNRILTVDEALKDENFTFVYVSLSKLNAAGVKDSNFLPMATPLTSSADSLMNLEALRAEFQRLG